MDHMHFAYTTHHQTTYVDATFTKDDTKSITCAINDIQKQRAAIEQTDCSYQKPAFINCDKCIKNLQAILNS